MGVIGIPPNGGIWPKGVIVRTVGTGFIGSGAVAGDGIGLPQLKQKCADSSFSLPQDGQLAITKTRICYRME